MKKPNLSEMTLREKIGQIVMPNQWDVYQVPEKNYEVNRTEDEWKAVIEKYQFGSYWSDQIGSYNKFVSDKEQNVEITTELSQDLGRKLKSSVYKDFFYEQNKCGKIPALVSTDSEYGAYYILEDASSVCSPLAIGATDSEELVYELGASLARELRSAGINWRWAPVCDIANSQNICYLRTFAPDDPDKLIRLVNAHIRGMQSEGVAGTAKHFPGQDRYDYRDSHFSPATISSDLDEWWREQGKIFKGIIDGGVYSVMVGHGAFPAVDDSVIKGKYRPATVSKKIITDLLKGELGFSGVVVTDSIEMAGLTGCYDTYEERIIDLVNAGNDVLLGARMPANDIIEQAVLDGKISMERIDDACQRVLDMKEKMGMFEETYFFPPYKMEDVAPKTREINLEIARKAITLVRDSQNLLPVDKNKIKNVTIVCSAHVDVFFKQLEELKKSFEARGINVHMQRRVNGSADMTRIDETSDLIIYAAYVGVHEPKGIMGLYGDECASYLYAFSKGKEKSIGVSFGHPLLHFFPMGNAETYINAYRPSPELMEAFVEGIFGEIPIVGKSPVQLYPDNIIVGPDM